MILEVRTTPSGYIRMENRDGEIRTYEWWRDWPEWKKGAECYIVFDPGADAERYARKYMDMKAKAGSEAAK